MAATLWELHDAWLGHAEYHRLIRKPAVTGAFLREMLEKFPDGGTRHE